MSLSMAELVAQWQEAWPRALEVWSRYTRLQPAHLCQSQVVAAAEGLRGSFAMIRFADQRVVIDLETIRHLSLEDYGVEILAHEIGHHVLAPANATDHARLLARIRSALPTLHQHAPMVANLYTDLLINDRLQRQADLRLADIYRALMRTSGAQGGDQSQAVGVWPLYMRIYEQLWQLERGELCCAHTDARLETDAWLGARLVRVYSRDWLEGAGRFASLLLPYLVMEQQSHQQAAKLLHDIASAGQGSFPAGLHEVDENEAKGAIHPAEDPLITGLNESWQEALSESAGEDEDLESPALQSTGQTREPFAYGEILRACGLTLTEQEVAIRYYRERALPYLVPYPK